MEKKEVSKTRVGNAREECKAVAGHVIKPYSEDGVLEILKSLL